MTDALESAADTVVTESAAPIETPPTLVMLAAALAQRREACGMSLADVSEKLKFSKAQIAAIEAGEIHSFHGLTYARGIVRVYARLLEMDSAPLLQAIQDVAHREEVRFSQPVSLRTPTPFSDSRKRSTLLYVVLSLVVLSIAGAVLFDWYLERQHPLTAAGASVALPIPPAVEGEGAVALITPPVAAALPAAATAAPEVPVTSATPARLPPPLGDGKRRLVLRFSADSWVQIHQKDGSLIYQQNNPAGSEKTLEGLPPFAVVIGNAPGVTMTYDGQPIDLRAHYKVDVARFTLE